jgi:hypothetical protein
MKYVASISKAELGMPDRLLKPEHRNIVIERVKAQAKASGWTVRLVERYEEFSAQDLSAGRVTLDVDWR